MLARENGNDMDAGVPVQDAGESLPGGVPPTAEELEAARLNPIAPEALPDHDLGPAIDVAAREGNLARVDAIADQIAMRHDDDRGAGTVMLDAIPRGQGGSARVTPEVALAMLENMAAGRPAFRPELGVGGASWFVTEGTPHAGVAEQGRVNVQVDLIDTGGGRVYVEADLLAVYAQEEARLRPEIEAQVRERFRVRTGRPAPAKLSNALASQVEHHLKKAAERSMWTRIGQEVAASARKVGEVVLPPNDRFSAAPGRFKIVADATKIRLRGGPLPLIEALRPHASPVPALEAETQALARRMQLAGRVRAVFRIGGRILIFAAVAHDVYRIVVAEDKLETTIESVGGWAGATAGAAAFTALWTPADVAGPWAWAAHGVGTLVAGGLGYWVGSETTRSVYRLVVVSDGTVRAH